MKIQILGTRGEVEPSAPYHARHSGILIDDRFMFDLGEKEFLIGNVDDGFINTELREVFKKANVYICG